MALYQEVETQMPGEDKDETEDASSDSELDHTQCLLGRESRSEKSNIAWPQHRRERRSQMSQLVVQILILVLLAYIAVISTIETFTGLEKSPRLQQNKDPKYPKLPNSPANMAVKYEYQKLGKDPYSKWYGPPSDGVDAAWDALLEAMNIRATKEEFEVQSENFTDIVQMADGDYLGIIGVWHQIHCLDVMRRAFHLDYYQPDLGDGETEVYNTNHYDHCIENLRRAVMCHPDLSMWSAYWVADSHEPDSKLLRSEGESVCVNWDSLNQWALTRRLERRKFKLRAGRYEKGHSQDHLEDVQRHE